MTDKKPNLFQRFELKIDKQSDLTKRLISSIFLGIFVVIYVGLSIIYQQGNWKGLKNAEVASYFNFFISALLVGAAAYELMKAMGVHKVQNGIWYMVFGILGAMLLFIWPWDGHSWAMYDLMQDFNHWYVVLLINVLLILMFSLIGYFSTKSAVKTLLLLFYIYLVVIGFKGFSTIALSVLVGGSKNLEHPNWDFGWNTIIWIWATIMLTDTFAYLGGRKFGKTKLAPSISPNKTWEGSAIGSGSALVFGILYSVLFAMLLPDYSPLYSQMTKPDMAQWAVGLSLAFLTLMITLAGQIGDLMFSWFKRQFEIKDFSKLIPGHGGILDRMDSFIFVFFIFYFICLAIN